MDSPLTEPLWQGAIDLFLENAGEDIDISIRDFRVLSSYGWLECAKRTIVVPGYPPLFRDNPSMPFQMIPAKGTIIIDQNAYRRPSCPLEPLFRAVYHTLPNFDPTGVDLVTDRNNLRKLLSAISSNGDCNENFRIDVQFLGNTMIFTRWNNSLEENIMSPRYRETFLKTITLGGTWSPSHHRVVRFSWGGLDVIERHTVDACVEGKDGRPTLVGYMPPAVSSSGLKIIGRGSLVDQYDLLQFKALESDSDIDMRRIFPRLYFSQVSSLLLGYHRYGTFERIERDTNLNENVNSEKSIKVWQEQMASELGAVVRAIRIIRQVLRESEQVWGVVIVEKGQLRIYGRQTDDGSDKAPGKLPEDLILKWPKVKNAKH